MDIQEQIQNQNHVTQYLQSSELQIIQMINPPFLNKKLTILPQVNSKAHKTKKIKKDKTELYFLRNSTNLRKNNSNNSQCQSMYSDIQIKTRKNKIHKPSISILSSTQASRNALCSSQSKKSLIGFSFQDSQIQIENQEVIDWKTIQNDNHEICQYFSDIVNYCLSTQFSPPTLGILRTVQKQGTFKNRMQLVNLISSLRFKLGLLAQTQYLAHELLDLMMIRFRIPAEHHQLFVAACLTISWKFNEVKVFCMNQLCYQMGILQYRQYVKQIESKILSYLDWKINILSSYDFVGFMLMENPGVKDLAKQIIKIAMQNFEIRQFRQSVVALTCIQIAKEKMSLVISSYSNGKGTMECKQFILKVLKDATDTELDGLVGLKNVSQFCFSCLKE